MHREWMQASVAARSRVTGDNVALLDGAHLDVSGSTGGGTALIGGGYQGGDPELQNAARTFVSQSAEIRADALDAGDGGRVVVWADGDTRFHGAISAKGGSAGGNGGFVEVSGKAAARLRRQRRHVGQRCGRSVRCCSTRTTSTSLPHRLWAHRRMRRIRFRRTTA